MDGIAGDETQRLWQLRCSSLFDPGIPVLSSDFFSGPPPSVEVRLCAGLASRTDWDALTDLCTRVRAFAPAVILRLELWLDAGAPTLLSPHLLETLRRIRPLFVHFWVRQEVQITAEVRALWGLLVEGGIPVVGELLLARSSSCGVDGFRRLCLSLLELRVRPYVMVEPAWLPSAERLPAEEAEKLVRGLRGWISGLAVPQWIEESGTGIRVPRIPAYVLTLDEAGMDAFSYSGTRHRYQNPPKSTKKA